MPMGLFLSPFLPLLQGGWGWLLYWSSTYLGENTKGKLGTRMLMGHAWHGVSLESFKQKAGGCKGFNVTIK